MSEFLSMNEKPFYVIYKMKLLSSFIFSVEYV